MSVKMRQHVERQIIRRFLLDATHAGYWVAADVGDDSITPRTNKAKTLLDQLFACDEEVIFVYHPSTTLSGNENVAAFGWVKLVYGNDGWDVISDYTVNLEPLMAGVNKLVDKYGD